MRDKRKTLDKKEENLKFKKLAKKQKLQERGITLIALVVTIIILLILAGTTLNIALSDNGLFSKTKEATKKYQIASEKEYLEQSVLSVQLDKYIGNVSSEKIGEALNKKSLESSSDWHIIKVGDTSYENGWNYVDKGTELQGYGKTEHGWLVNYETGEIIELEEDNYISLSAGDMLAVKDNLIINVDSSIIDKNVENSEKALEEQFGDGVDLVGFDFNGNSESGLTSTSFNFDGVDDYIKVKYDSEEQKKKLAENGFTFEFYGTWDGGNSYNSEHQSIENLDFRGLFCYWDGVENAQAALRFGICPKREMILWNAGFNDFLSDYCESNANAHNIMYKIKNFEKLKEGSYITVTLDASDFYQKNEEEYEGTLYNIDEMKNGQFYKQTIYVDGQKLYEGDYNKLNWDGFASRSVPSLKYFCVGRSSMSDNGCWHYSKMKAYCLRLYSRALSEEEVNKNYEKSIEYHSLLEE